MCCMGMGNLFECSVLCLEKLDQEGNASDLNEGWGSGGLAKFFLNFGRNLIKLLCLVHEVKLWFCHLKRIFECF